MKAKKRLLSLTLSAVMAMSMAAPAYAAPEAPAAEGNPLSLENVVSIQAITEGTYYGTGVTAVEITYKDNVDVSEATKEDYVLTDRGSLKADFGVVDIEDVTVNGQVVTLDIQRDSDATEANVMVYSGSNKEGARQRDSYGVYVTGAWYRDAEGVIHYGNGDEAQGYVANETKMGYQVRECLELKLQVAGEDAVECLADDLGHYNADGKWLETIDTQFGEGKFQKLTDLQIPSTAATANWEGTGSAAADYVDGYYYVPENYDPANGIVFTLQGQGISYWKLPDGTDNAGTGIMFDCATTSWANKGAIVVNIHDRSSQQTLAEEYDFVVDDANVMKYFIDTYKVTGNIVLQGNSRGTMASDIVIKALAGCAYNPKEQAMGWNGEKTKKLDKSVYDFNINTYICQNGSMGSTYWPGDDKKAIAATGLKVWAFDGEQDTNNIESVAEYAAVVAECGYSDAWIAENIRLTGLTSNLTYYWGESDHSATRTNGWFFSDDPYYGPMLHIDENGEIVYDEQLNDGDTYVLEGRGAAGENSKNGYEYTVYDDVFQVWALADAVEPTEIKDIDAIASLETDYSQAAQLPVTGYFNKNVAVNGETRTAKLYLSDTVSIRPYYTIVAVPDGVDTTEFLKAEGWFDVIDAQGEALYVLEPGKDGWGTAEEEADYVKAAMSFVSGGKNDQGVAVVTTFGEHYLVGYGKGAAALELWAAANPILVVAQTYIDGESAGAEALTAVASAEINGKSSNGDITDVLDATIETVGITEGRIAAKDIAVPTIFAGYTGSEAYWMAANDCVATPVDGVYAQDINSDAYATAYANTVRKAAGETTGLSQVKVTEAGAKAAEIYGYMAQWTRYDTTFSYSNALAPRMNYAAAKVEAQTEAKAGKAEAVLSDGTEIWGQGQVVVPGHGTFEVGVMTFSDQNNDGKNDPREYMLYIPEGFEGKKLPVLFVYPGNTQTDIVFMDSTGWWQVADEKGFAVVMVCETYSSPVAATHVDSIGYYNAMMTVLKEQVDGKKAALDFNRVYASGQSLGSNETQAMALEHPEMFACVASTSGAPFTVPSAIVGQIPAMMITGQMDAGTMAKGFEDVGGLIPWGNHMLAAAGIDATFTAESATSVTKVDGRHEAVYAWENAQGIPMLQWGQCLLRPHNCHPSDMPILWDYMEHFAKTEDGTRCYSASAFAEDDAVVIAENEVKDMQEKVVDVKATVAPNFYGHKVSQVVVTFAEGTNPYLLQNADINVWDRGSANPNFGTLKVVDKKVEGNVVTLTINTDSDKLTDRSRNTYGNLTCTGWYMDLEGNIYCAAAADTKDAFGNEILANKAGKTCQPRNLDLVLTVNNDDVTAGIMSTDTKGNWINNPVWEEIELTGGLELVEQKFVNIGAPAPGYDLVSENGEVPVQVIWPENYDAKRAEAYPVIVYQCGGGVCYWQLQAGENGNIAAAHNLGDNVVYDNMMTEWHRMFPEAIVMSVNIHSTNTEASAAEINAVLRYANENWNAAAGKAVLVGNSQGTILGSDAIRQAPELFAGFVECNGNFGANIQVTQTDGTVANSSFGKWTEEEFANMIANDVSCWMFNGETDGTNAGVAQDTYEVLAKAYAAKGYSDEWIYNHIRVSGLQSWKFKQWGETDHSVTKVVAWQYIANPYTDVYENANMKPGQKYKFTGKEAYNYYDYTMDFDYTVYAESVSEWAKALVGGQYDEEIKVPEAPVKAEQTIVTAANASAITKVYGAKAFNLGAKTNGDGKITYKSSNTKVAKVDKNGKVTIKGTGKAVITITAAETENCAAATLKVTIKVVPKKGAVASAKASKKSIVVKAKKDAQATGYQIQVSSSINFTKKATCTYTGKKVSTTVKNLKAGTYYVRTRSYKTVGSKKYYGAYSAVKVVVVK